MSNGKAIPRTDYEKVQRLAERVGCCENSIRAFAKQAGIKPKYFLSTAMFSYSEIIENLADSPHKKK